LIDPYVKAWKVTGRGGRSWSDFSATYPASQSSTANPLANFDGLVSPLPWAFLHNQDP
jgi:hypothetical protein